MDRIVIIGEVLFDHFPDGSTVLGGAPFNVAWHLTGFGLRPLLLTRVGNDAAGDAILAAMRAWGMDTGGVQRDPEHPTGRVEVTGTPDEPHYTIVADQAYDHLDLDAAINSLHHAVGLVCHGTLAQRTPSLRAAFARLPAHWPRLVDLNLRAPWYDDALLRETLQATRWLKLSTSELHTVARAARIEPDADSDSDSDEALAGALRAQFDLDWVLLTQGAQGAAIVTDSVIRKPRPATETAVVDTVGAGDAFCAVAIWGLLANWPVAQLLDAAQGFAASIVARQGATHADPALYRPLRQAYGTG